MLRAERDGTLISLDDLSLGKQQKWLESQPPPRTRAESSEHKRVKRRIKNIKDEENE